MHGNDAHDFIPADSSETKTFLARAPVTDDQILASLPFLPWDRACEAAKLLVEKWLGEMSYFRAGGKKQKWALRPAAYSGGTDQPTKKMSDAYWTLTLATAMTHYYIHVRPTYLGCTAVSRVVDPGETHSRGNDLPDGPFDRNTWARILTEMLAYEFLDIPKEEALETLPDLWAFVDEAQGKEKADWALERERQKAERMLPGAVAREVGFDEIEDAPAPAVELDDPQVVVQVLKP